MDRIMVIGSPGSGKSTVARWLGEVTDLPIFHMDQIHYSAGWAERSRALKIEMANEVEARERWIFEGGLSATQQNRADRADLIVWLDLPLPLRMWRVLRRTVTQYGRTRPDMPDDCPERFSPSFYWWILTTYKRQRRSYTALVAQKPSSRVRHLTTRREIADWMRDVEKQGCLTDD